MTCGSPALSAFVDIPSLLSSLRDAWKSVEGTSKEDAQTKYVEKLLEVSLSCLRRRDLPRLIRAEIDPQACGLGGLQEVRRRNRGRIGGACKSTAAAEVRAECIPPVSVPLSATFPAMVRGEPWAIGRVMRPGRGRGLGAASASHVNCLAGCRVCAADGVKTRDRPGGRRPGLIQISRYLHRAQPESVRVSGEDEGWIGIADGGSKCGQSTQ